MPLDNSSDPRILHIINEDGTSSTTNWSQEFGDQTEPDLLTWLQQKVGGYIQIERCIFNGKICQMIMDEEGKMKARGVNTNATTAYLAAHKAKPGDEDEQDIIVGNVVILDGWLLP